MSVPCRWNVLKLSLDTGWLHHRLGSCWKFPKLLFPLCQLCDLHFQGLSVRFVTDYLLPPRMKNHLLWVLVGICTGSAKRGRTGSCGIRLVGRTQNRTMPVKLIYMHACLCFYLCTCIFLTRNCMQQEGHYYRWCAINHMQACSKKLESCTNWSLFFLV